MTSKERVLTAFARQQPDRVPINYMANPGIDARLKQHFGLAAADDEGLRPKLGVDFRDATPNYIGPKLHPDIPGRQVNEWGVRARWVEHESGGYWDYCDFPLKDADVETVANWLLPSPDQYDYSAALDAARRYKDYAVGVGSPGFGDIINSNGFLRGTEQAFIDLITDDPAGLLLADRRLAVQLEVLRRTIEAARGGIDFLWTGEDLGTQNSPSISMELFRRHIRPRHQRLCDLARAYNLPIMVHTCGSSSWAYNDFIAMGVTVVDTLQPEAANMSPAYLKRTFGDRLAFHGCISTAGPVAYGTVDDVVRNVRETLEIMMPGGGYCLAPTHMLQDNSPTENILALYHAIGCFGQY